jgi:TusA-related sulfurtransferase
MHSEIPDWQFDDEFDGGEETCGRVIINLHLYLLAQPSGYRILVISRDPGAPMELPAWCRLTSNTLVAQQHPYYLITLK